MNSFCPGWVAVVAYLVKATNSRLRAVVRHAELEAQGHWGGVSEATGLGGGKA